MLGSIGGVLYVSFQRLSLIVISTVPVLICLLSSRSPLTMVNVPGRMIGSRVFSGLPVVSSSLDSIVDYIIPISKRMSARGHRVYQVYFPAQVAYLYIQEDEEHDGVCTSLEALRFDYPYCSLMGFFLSYCLEDCISLDLVVYGLILECHLRAVLFFPSPGFFPWGFFSEGFLKRQNHLASNSPDAQLLDSFEALCVVRWYFPIGVLVTVFR
ncbi:hypothetical protein Tco_1461346 [Tanacetum coccineum]